MALSFLIGVHACHDRVALNAPLLYLFPNRRDARCPSQPGRLISPIAAMVTAEVGREVHVQRKGTGGGVGSSQREAGLHQVYATVSV
jgi:hypothetical protein